MADRIDVEVTGKSQYEVAHEMARSILINMEGRETKSIKRQEFLHLVADCIDALRGIKVERPQKQARLAPLLGSSLLLSARDLHQLMCSDLFSRHVLFR